MIGRTVSAGIAGAARSAVMLVRWCSRCGRPLSRYNDRDYCGGCTTVGIRADDVHAGGADAAGNGLRLRASRLRRGMTLEVLAGLAGVSVSYVSMLENGHRRLDSYSRIVSLAHALSVPPAEIAPALGTAASQCLPDESTVSGEKEKVMAELTPPGWARPVEKELVVLWDAVDAADLAIMKALSEQGPASDALRRFSPEFSAAKDMLIGFLLAVLSPEEADHEIPDAAQAVS